MKSILIIIPYDPIYPPMNGGMQRCFHILHQLALHFKVTAIINQDKVEFEKALNSFPALVSVDVYSTKNEKEPVDLFSLLPRRIKNAMRYRWYKRTFAGTTDSNFLKYYLLLKSILKKNSFNAVILENLDTINAVDIIRRYDKKTVIIYDTHNVGSLLAEEEVEKGIMKTANMLAIHQAEQNLYKTVNAVLTCSDKDLDEFKKMNRNILDGIVIPNGVHLEDIYYDGGVQLDVPEYIVFCGSLGYEPNTEGLDWFYKSIWPKVKEMFPALTLLVLGSGKLPAHLLYMAVDKSLLFTGTVEDVKLWYNKASIAIAPLKSGSGTRLKILEAMGLGLPVIATSKGAEGIDYQEGENIIIADDDKAFVDELAMLLTNKKKRMLIQRAGRELMKKEYEWNIIGRRMASYLHQKIAENKL